MRIGLVNEGTYPVSTGGVSTWCNQLVTGLDEHEWHLLTITGPDARPVWELPPQVRSSTLVEMWGPAASTPLRRWRQARARRREVARALEGFWDAVLRSSSDELDPVAISDAAGHLRVLARPAAVPLASLLLAHGSTPAILRAWHARRRLAPDTPVLSVADAATAAVHVDRALALLDVEWPQVDLVHAASNGPAALVGLARSWRDDVPLLLTEHGVHLRERYIALSDLQLPWTVRSVVLAALRTISSVAYQHATAIAPVSDFNARWERRLGADPQRITTIHNGVDPEGLPVLTDEPSVPTLSFVGRIDPLKDLETLVDAFALVKQEVPAAQLRIFGPCPPGNEDYLAVVRARIARDRVAGITFEGPTAGPLPAFEAGHVVVLSSVSEGLPFTVIEAMMAGRATVSTDVGGVGEIVGRSGTVGALVPARDPAAFAAACVRLLTDADHRRSVAEVGRVTALERFTLDRCLGAYRQLYDSVAGPKRASAGEPRSAHRSELDVLEEWSLVR
jgi:glycosyltransferase involved in cell wall biosynthesis